MGIKLQLGKYSTLLKILTIIPFLVGMLTMLEDQFPMREISAQVVSKSSNYRLKTNTTTYTIDFGSIDDQFTEYIFNSFQEGDLVELKATQFHKQIREIKRLSDQKIFENSTSEPYFLFVFGLVFLLSGISWFKRGPLSDTQAKYLSFVITLSVISLLRILFA
ncbi:MAG: hypothetical protein KC456_08120 [Flavobacteriales bacterium]|nr:hypothetical protein [Flavobacteriales bacterium]